MFILFIFFLWTKRDVGTYYNIIRCLKIEQSVFVWIHVLSVEKKMIFVRRITCTENSYVFCFALHATVYEKRVRVSRGPIHDLSIIIYHSIRITSATSGKSSRYHDISTSTTADTFEYRGNSAISVEVLVVSKIRNVVVFSKNVRD